ncbi:VOC family protein [Cryobacterium cheniae]|uniref:VOC family protein n=1 Tax=Cryobacterium cheniae TaxID=1259262 RepID=UPI001F548265|nr:VOC family protein [Cryobacterium cheniae]
MVVWTFDDDYSIRPVANRMPGLTFVTVLEAKVGKSRLHLDFHPSDQNVEVDRLLCMGAKRADIGQGEQS